ncbi:hypothetical protein MMC18_002546 [Xylographa bjoerkii]|nr:hypothetical protein [Xylographa bjoerkii]
MPPKVIIKTKRTRASVPKVRTGCRTCKIRHVKCDEQKPNCLRCSSTGRTCDGYGVEVSAQSTLVEDFQVISLGHSACFNSPSVSIPGNEKERRSFDFFRFQTLQELEIALNTPAWNRLILQASHSSPVIRNAAIALGSLGERFYINEVLTRDNAAANSCHVYARLQYQKALQGLRDYLYYNKGEYTVGLTLISCFMFVVFEFMQGNEAAALTHLRSGLKILRSFQPKSNEVTLARNGLCVSHSSLDPLMADIARVYTILDMQATLWLGLNTFEAQGMAPNENTVCPTDVSNFAGLEAAEVSLNSQIGQILYYRRALPPENTWDPMDAAYVIAMRERERLIAQLDKWPIAIKVLLLQISNDLEIQDLQRVTVMTINHKITFVLLSVSMQYNAAELFHSFENIFEDILRLATSLLQPTTSMTNEKFEPVSRSVHALGGPMPVFHFTAGIIQPVYFTAVKCRNRILSQRAISMLSTSPWREGAWDSAAMAKIAERKVLQLEGEGWYDTSQSSSPSKSSADVNSLGLWSVETDLSGYYHCLPHEKGSHYCRRCKKGYHGVSSVNFES